MAVSNKNYVDAVKFQQILLAHGLSIQPQAGFVKVTAENSQRLYVAKTKRVGRVDLAFKLEGEGFHVLSEGEKFGAIETQLDFSLPEEQILANFEKALEHMKSLPKPEQKAKEGKKKGEAAPKAAGWSPEILKATKAINASSEPDKRAKLLVEMAASKKAPLSPKVLASLPAEWQAKHAELFAPPAEEMDAAADAE